MGDADDDVRALAHSLINASEHARTLLKRMRWRRFLIFQPYIAKTSVMRMGLKHCCNNNNNKKPDNGDKISSGEAGD